MRFPNFVVVLAVVNDSVDRLNKHLQYLVLVPAIVPISKPIRTAAEGATCWRFELSQCDDPTVVSSNVVV